MAHSLFEPAPTPLSEKLWRRMKDFNIGRAPRTARQTDPALMRQATHLDARGRQELLEAVLTAKPIHEK